MCDWYKKKIHFTDSVSGRQFREFRDFSAIVENHWPYICNIFLMASSFSDTKAFPIRQTCAVDWFYCFLYRLAMYFPGIFAPVTKISKGAVNGAGQTPRMMSARSSGSVDTSHVTARVDTGQWTVTHHWVIPCQLNRFWLTKDTFWHQNMKDCVPASQYSKCQTSVDAILQRCTF